MHTSSHTVLHDPDGLIEAGLPLDREPYESLVKAVLAWTDQKAPQGYGLVTRPSLRSATARPCVHTFSPPYCGVNSATSATGRYRRTLPSTRI
ncbi:hypothetical protein [Streptomyces sp. NRRL S-920]|uniref:hypothetical protein n=1 Tax=Streptomyces sp. NRRL S-920 TaxID=1463921 RepID=UPI00131CF8D5|nr:hypothetical protein [Streptomyces sp. NRRL S-920]